jgi:hypothetical protein
MLDFTNGQYSEVEFESHFKQSEFYTEKARLIRLIEKYQQTVLSGAPNEKAEAQVRVEECWTLLESMHEPVSNI